MQFNFETLLAQEASRGLEFALRAVAGGQEQDSAQDGKRQQADAEFGAQLHIARLPGPAAL